MKIGAIIQARKGSTRLPGKVLKKLHGKTVLAHDIERIAQSKRLDMIVVATTVEEADDAIVDEAVKIGVPYFRGSEQDVLSRYYFAAKEQGLDVVVRITSDCPLIDPFVIDQVVDAFLEQGAEIATNASSDWTKRTFPRGLDTEVFTFQALEKAFYEAKVAYQREHVTPFLYEHSTNIYYVRNDIDYSNYRLTLDVAEDFELIEKIYDALYHGKHDFYLKEIVELLIKRPELALINKAVEQKKLGE